MERSSKADLANGDPDAGRKKGKKTWSLFRGGVILYCLFSPPQRIVSLQRFVAELSTGDWHCIGY